MAESDTMFDRFIFVDWSASKGSNTGENSIWIGSCSRNDMTTLDAVNPSTRTEALSCLKEIITENRKGKILIGFDFGFGYPHEAYKPDGIGKDWKSLWQKFHRNFYEEDYKKGKERFRFTQAKEWNKEYGLCFWGEPNTKKNTESIGLEKDKVKEAMENIGEFRITDKRASWSGVKSLWQLYGAGSVGSQSLLGIPYVEKLRNCLEKKIKVWPFETQFGKNLKDFDVLLCEVHFAAITRVGANVMDRTEKSSEVKDRIQVEEMCRFFAEEDKDGSLLQKFLTVDCACVSKDDRSIAQTKEGWILGVPLCLQPCDRPHKNHLPS